MELLLERPSIISLAVAGGVFALLASVVAARGTVDAQRARVLTYVGYAFMGASMLLFVIAGLRS